MVKTKNDTRDNNSIGVDMSGSDCNNMVSSDWSCLVNNGYDFAIIQTWQGGYQYTSNIGTTTFFTVC